MIRHFFVASPVIITCVSGRRVDEKTETTKTEFNLCFSGFENLLLQHDPG